MFKMSTINRESIRQNGFMKDIITKEQNGIRKDISYRPISEQLLLIDTLNNEAIRAGKSAYMSGNEEEDSESEYVPEYRHGSTGMSSDLDSSSDDEGDDKNKMTYEHYDPDMFEYDKSEEQNKSIDENDDCKFGQSQKKHIMREILHHGLEMRPNVIDDFGGWDATFTVRNSKPPKSNTRRCSKPRTASSVVPRPSTGSKENIYQFKHYEDISEYMTQYRLNRSVKDNRIKHQKDGEEGILCPDPYATKLKSNMCSIAENCDFLTVYSSNAKDKTEKPKEKESAKEKQPRDEAVSKQSNRPQPRPFSDSPFIVRTLSVRDRSRMLNLAPVRNQDATDGKPYKPNSVQTNLSLDQYLNLVLPNRQLRRSNSNLTAQSLSTADDKDEVKTSKPALHKKNIQLNIDGPCDPWTPKFELKRSVSRGAGSPYKPTNSAGISRKKSTPTPDSSASKQWPIRPELTLSRASTYHSHFCPKSDSVDNELSVNSCSNRSNPPNVQRVYGQRFRCCERIHALISSNSDEANRRPKDRHIKLSVDNLRTEKTNPVSFGSFGVRKGMSREETSVALSCLYKLKRERQRRFNISLVK